MNHHTKRPLIAALIFAVESFAHADINTSVYELGGGAMQSVQSVSTALQAVGTDFIIGCTVLAVGIVAGVFISKKK